MLIEISMKKLLIFLSFLLVTNGFSQNVGLNTTSPDISAALDIFSGNKGLLIPRVNLVDVTNIVSPIASPSTGLMVWNTNNAVVGGFGVGFYFFNGTKWIKFQDPNDLDAAYDTNGPGLGRIIIADAGAVKITGTDGLLVTGTFGTGEIINNEITGAGVRMYFNPRTAAFRAGGVADDSWDSSEIGNYSCAFGQNNESKSGRTFTANYFNQANTNGINGGAFGNTNRAVQNASYAFGNQTISAGNNSFSTGLLTEARGYDSFTSGEGSVAPSQSEVALGVYPKNYSVFDNSDVPFTDSDSKFYTQDRLFVIGNGASSAAKHNALEIWKDNSIKINEAYSIPVVDGTLNQTLKTNGTGTVTWTSFEKNITQINLYADNSSTVMSNTANADIGNIITALIPNIFDPAGNIRIKLIIRYTTKTGNSQIFRLLDHNNTVIIGSGSFTDISTTTGGVFESTWVNFAGGASLYNVKLNGRVISGDSVTIKNVLMLVQAQ